nr:hypothetical protein [Tanacetum cinerariifolium]
SGELYGYDDVAPPSMPTTTLTPPPPPPPYAAITASMVTATVHGPQPKKILQR